MRTKNQITMISVCVVVVISLASCASTKKSPTAKQEIVGSSPATRTIVTLEKKPTWLLLGGMDVIDSRGGDIMTVGGDFLELFGFRLENDEPDSNPLVVTIVAGNRIIYWKGNGTITNVSRREKVALPLSHSEDPRSDEDREAALRKAG